MHDRNPLRRTGVLVLALLLSTVSWVAVAGSGAPGEDPDLFCRPSTIDIGEISGFGNQRPLFLGGDMIIRDGISWGAFWRQHTSIYDPQRPAPEIDFRSQVVIAVVQGQQNSGGGPSITIAGLRHGPSSGAATDPGAVSILVVDDERPGPLDVITNPYHIAVVQRRCLPDQATVGFRHVAPDPTAGTVRGHVFVPTNAVDWLGIPNATVFLAGADGRRRDARTGRDGSYAFLRVPPGAYQLSVYVPPFQPEVTPVTIEAGDVEVWDFYLVPAP